MFQKMVNRNWHPLYHKIESPAEKQTLKTKDRKNYLHPEDNYPQMDQQMEEKNYTS